MKLETFFEKFELFAEAPGAVQRMRELVLGLAIQGKLVDQKKGDGKATELLAAISLERDVRASKLRTPEIPLSTDDSKHKFNIPSSWTWTQLGNIALQIQYGYTASADASITDIRMLRITDIQDNRVDWLSVPGCQIESEEAAKYLLSPNDILIARTGGTIGKSFIVDEIMVKSVFASYLIRVTPPRSMAARYLKAFLESPLYWSQLRQMSAGTGQPNVNGQALGRLEIPLPPLAEQERIVAKADELMALCDQLEEQQQEREAQRSKLARASLARFFEASTQTNLASLFHPSYEITPADLRKSILTLAVQGKLVPQNPKDENVEDSLARNDRQRRDVAYKDHRSDADNQPILSADDRWEIADTWSWRGLADLVLFVDYRGKTPAKLSDGVRLLTAKNVRKGQINLSPEEFLSETEYDAWMTRGFPKQGDVLFTTEAPMGNAAVVDFPERFALAQRVICFQSYGAIDPDFLAMQIISDQFQSILDKNGTGVTAKGIKASKLKQLPIAVPPITEQRRIVAKVNKLTALIDELEAQLVASRAFASNLLTALVDELIT